MNLSIHRDDPEYSPKRDAAQTEKQIRGLLSFAAKELKKADVKGIDATTRVEHLDNVAKTIHYLSELFAKEQQFHPTFKFSAKVMANLTAQYDLLHRQYKVMAHSDVVWGDVFGSSKGLDKKEVRELAALYQTVKTTQDEATQERIKRAFENKGNQFEGFRKDLYAASSTRSLQKLVDHPQFSKLVEYHKAGLEMASNPNEKGFHQKAVADLIVRAKVAEAEGEQLRTISKDLEMDTLLKKGAEEFMALIPHKDRPGFIKRMDLGAEWGEKMTKQFVKISPSKANRSEIKQMLIAIFSEERSPGSVEALDLANQNRTLRDNSQSPIRMGPGIEAKLLSLPEKLLEAAAIHFQKGDPDSIKIGEQALEFTKIALAEIKAQGLDPKGVVEKRVARTFGSIGDSLFKKGRLELTKPFYQSGETILGMQGQIGDQVLAFYKKAEPLEARQKLPDLLKGLEEMIGRSDWKKVPEQLIEMGNLVRKAQAPSLTKEFDSLKEQAQNRAREAFNPAFEQVGELNPDGTYDWERARDRMRDLAPIVKIANDPAMTEEFNGLQRYINLHFIRQDGAIAPLFGTRTRVGPPQVRLPDPYIGQRFTNGETPSGRNLAKSLNEIISSEETHQEALYSGIKNLDSILYDLPQDHEDRTELEAIREGLAKSYELHHQFYESLVSGLQRGEETPDSISQKVLDAFSGENFQSMIDFDARLSLFISYSSDRLATYNKTSQMLNPMTLETALGRVHTRSNQYALSLKEALSHAKTSKQPSIVDQLGNALQKAKSEAGKAEEIRTDFI